MLLFLYALGDALVAAVAAVAAVIANHLVLARPLDDVAVILCVLASHGAVSLVAPLIRKTLKPRITAAKAREIAAAQTRQREA